MSRYLMSWRSDNLDRRLVPPIIAANIAVFVLFFGLMFTISGLILCLVDKPSDSSSNRIHAIPIPMITPLTADPLPATMSDIVYLDIQTKDSSSKALSTVATIILSVGSVLDAIGFAFLLYSWIAFIRYQNIKRNELRNANNSTNDFFEITLRDDRRPTRVESVISSEQLYTIEDTIGPPSYSALHRNNDRINDSFKGCYV